MKRRICPSSPRRCWRNAGNLPSISVTSSGRLDAELAISRTLFVCFWNAFGNRTLTDITLPRQAQSLACSIVLFHKLFKVGQPRTNRLALAVSALQAVGRLQAVAGDAAYRELIRLDPPMR